MTHELKTIQPFFDDVWTGRKKFEVRKADRPYAEGDNLALREWDGEKFTDRGIFAVVTYCVSLAPVLPEECADAFLMLLHLAHRNGFDLEAEARKKFERVRNAEWVDDGRGYKKRVK
jgi:hypothetical protein